MELRAHGDRSPPLAQKSVSADVARRVIANAALRAANGSLSNAKDLVERQRWNRIYHTKAVSRLIPPRPALQWLATVAFTFEEFVAKHQTMTPGPDSPASRRSDLIMIAATSHALLAQAYEHGVVLGDCSRTSSVQVPVSAGHIGAPSGSDTIAAESEHNPDPQ